MKTFLFVCLAIASLASQGHGLRIVQYPSPEVENKNDTFVTNGSNGMEENSGFKIVRMNPIDMYGLSENITYPDNELAPGFIDSSLFTPFNFSTIDNEFERDINIFEHFGSVFNGSIEVSEDKISPGGSLENDMVYVNSDFIKSLVSLLSDSNNVSKVNETRNDTEETIKPIVETVPKTIFFDNILSENITYLDNELAPGFVDSSLSNPSNLSTTDLNDLVRIIEALALWANGSTEVPEVKKSSGGSFENDIVYDNSDSRNCWAPFESFSNNVSKVIETRNNTDGTITYFVEMPENITERTYKILNCLRAISESTPSNASKIEADSSDVMPYSDSVVKLLLMPIKSTNASEINKSNENTFENEKVFDSVFSYHL